MNENLLEFPTQTQSQAVLDARTRRRGNAVELICNCCQLPISEILSLGARAAGHADAASLKALNIYSRHYGKTHANQVKLLGVELIVTDAREFVIVPSVEAIRRLAA